MRGPVAEIRRNEIENRLKRGLPVNATALAEEFLVSEDAVRRDLRALAAEGKCKRVYGGAIPLSPEGGPLEHRLVQDVHEKRALSLAALSLPLRPPQCSSTVAARIWRSLGKFRSTALLRLSRIRSRSQPLSSNERIFALPSPEIAVTQNSIASHTTHLAPKFRA